MHKMSFFSKKIIHWQKINGRNNLPWQAKSPYHVWISEIMLQQTQVKTVIPYFHKFINSFPSIKSLAESNLDNVLASWSGLGYYTRAKNIHLTSKIIHEKYNGSIPNNYDQLIELPGIGESTAGALLSLAFDEPGIILDGNVKRVLSRVLANQSPINQPKTQNELKKFANEILPKKNFRTYSQGMMDLGSLICTSNNPSCESCPIKSICKSFELNLQNSIPVKTSKNPKKERNINWVLISSKDKVLLKRNKSKGVWQNLWLFPEENYFDDKKFNLLEEKESLPLITHNLSHQKLSITTKKYFLKNKDRLPIDRRGFVWVNKKESVKMGIPKPVKLILENHL